MIDGMNSDQRLLAVQEKLGAPVSPVWLKALWEGPHRSYQDLADSAPGDHGGRHEDSRGGLSIDPKVVSPDDPNTRIALEVESLTMFWDMADREQDIEPYPVIIVPGIDNPNALRHLVTSLYRQCSDAGVQVYSHIPASLHPLLDYALECADEAEAHCLWRKGLW